MSSDAKRVKVKTPEVTTTAKGALQSAVKTTSPGRKKTKMTNTPRSFLDKYKNQPRLRSWSAEPGLTYLEARSF